MDDRSSLRTSLCTDCCQYCCDTGTNILSKQYKNRVTEAITLHKAAKDAFNELGIKKLPKVKDLSAEYAEVLADKKAAYAQYRNARTEMQDYLKAQKNVEQFLNLTRQEEEKAQEEKRKEETQR